MRRIVLEALKATAIFVILPRQEGYEGDSPETKFQTTTS